MFYWNSVAGSKLNGQDGAIYELGSLYSVGTQPACFLDRKGTAIIRIWNGEDSTTVSELKRRVNDFDSKSLAQLGLKTFTELRLDSTWFGYSTPFDQASVKLSDLIRWDQKEPWLTWYSRFGLQSRLRLAYCLSSVVSQWSTTGFARCEWPLNSFSVRENGDVWCDDPESFSRSRRARMIARSDPFALAPELLNGSRQP